ncbi:MAG: glycoside hydrolase family 2 TIM barrel-domain containing protein [bacterium]
MRKAVLAGIVMFLVVVSLATVTWAQMYLDSGWAMKEAALVKDAPESVSQVGYKQKKWLEATVPGTVLTTLVNNGIYPDPYFSNNNSSIPESLNKQSYWYRLEFSIPESMKGKQIWLHLEGINYRAEVWLNAKKLDELVGMHKRNVLNISDASLAGAKNCLAVKVSPPDHPGTPSFVKNGGDSIIGRDVTMQSTIGWDWNRPVRDRNTGMWDDVYVVATGPVDLRHPHIITDLPLPETDKANLTVSAELFNPTNEKQSGQLTGTIGEIVFTQDVSVEPNQMLQVEFSSSEYEQLLVENPRLWWPNGYGEQELYDMNLSFKMDTGDVSDEEKVRFGIREITSDEPKGMERVFYVNGKKVFCKGGNWVVTDMMLRFTRHDIAKKRYDTEVRYAKEANLTMLRIWGGSITERKEFYDACDKYGILVMQDFWVTGDCNGRYGGSRSYPDDKELFLESARDAIKMIRNHPSLAFWCGGNEVRAPQEIERALRNDILPELDGTRVFVAASDEEGLHGHGPYHFTADEKMYYKSSGFTTELGTYAVPTVESMRKMFEKKDLWPFNSMMWTYHNTFRGFDNYNAAVNRYSFAENIDDYCTRAQLLNYVSHRAMFEGWHKNKWDNTSGILIWKYNSVWPSLIWQLYDWYLDPNAGYYSTKIACEPLHIMWAPDDDTVYVVNNKYQDFSGLKYKIFVYNIDMEEKFSNEGNIDIQEDSVKKVLKIAWPNKLSSVHFIKVKLYGKDDVLVSQNFYWRTTEKSYKDIQKLPDVKLETSGSIVDKGESYLVTATLKNPSGDLAFFIRLKPVRDRSGERILPFFATDNYISLLPQEERSITIDFYKDDLKGEKPKLLIKGWNVKEKEIPLVKN